MFTRVLTCPPASPSDPQGPREWAVPCSWACPCCRHRNSAQTCQSGPWGSVFLVENCSSLPLPPTTPLGVQWGWPPLHALHVPSIPYLCLQFRVPSAPAPHFPPPHQGLDPNRTRPRPIRKLPPGQSEPPVSLGGRGAAIARCHLPCLLGQAVSPSSSTPSAGTCPLLPKRAPTQPTQAWTVPAPHYHHPSLRPHRFPSPFPPPLPTSYAKSQTCSSCRNGIIYKVLKGQMCREPKAPSSPFLSFDKFLA